MDEELVPILVVVALLPTKRDTIQVLMERCQMPRPVWVEAIPHWRRGELMAWLERAREIEAW